MKYRYIGDAPGQAESIRLCGLVWQRGCVHDVEPDIADVLRRVGGFEPAELADPLPGVDDDHRVLDLDAPDPEPDPDDGDSTNPEHLED